MLFFIIFIASCTSKIEKEEGKVNVVVSFYPLEEFTKSIGGDKVSVTTLVSPGVEPHEWEPSPNDIVKLTKADILIYNGAGLESWINKLFKIIDAKRTLIVEASKGIGLIRKSDDSNALTDPHVWLDPALAETEVQNIVEGLSKVDPAGTEFYRFNENNLIKRLKILDAKFKSELSNCKKNEFVTSHDAFSYLAKRYGLLQTSVAGISSEMEPTPKHIAELIDFIKQKNINTIFVETMVNPKISEALAKDTGSRIEILNPFEGLTQEQISAGENYFSVMEQNLNKLKIALDCKK